MNLADKLCYPQEIYNEKGDPIEHCGLTFRERLIIALAGNPALIMVDEKIKDRNPDSVTTEKIVYPVQSTKAMIQFADAIIKELDRK